MSSAAPLVRQIVPSVDDEASGPSYSVNALSSAIRAHGLDSEVMAVGHRTPDCGLQIFQRDFERLPLARRLWFSGELRNALDRAAAKGALLHAHGLWLMPNLYPARVAQRHGVPLVVSPRGMLGAEALAFSSGRKRIAWVLGQRRALQVAQCLHATSLSELEDIRRAGLTAPAAVIPNGIHVPSVYSAPRARTVLYLGRIHPKKGIDRLITAWARVADRHPDWRLRIVGPTEIGYREKLERQVRELVSPRVEFCDPLYGDDKWQAYSQAGLFVLPTLNENFGMVVAEALSAGVPVVCTKGAPWEGLEVNGCGWWIDHGAEALASALDNALSLPDEERHQMGARGRTWMARDFGWDSIAEQMIQVYSWCLGQRPRPECVTT